MADHKQEDIINIDKFLLAARDFQFLADMIALQITIKNERRNTKNDSRTESDFGRVDDHGRGY
jgi:hypothetical protein